MINTICAATSERQQAAATLANRCDCMVVGGRQKLGNTRRLAQICADACERTHHIEEASELQAAWFTEAHHIGITAGASTLQEHIERAVVASRSFAANHGPDRTRIAAEVADYGRSRDPEPGEGARS